MPNRTSILHYVANWFTDYSILFKKYTARQSFNLELLNNG
jgi:hypothetical protein